MPFVHIVHSPEASLPLQQAAYLRLALAGAAIAPVAVVLIVLAVLIATGLGAIGAALALRTGSAEAIQASFPLFFALLFLSSMSMPRQLMYVEWFRTIATYNPVSYLVEGLRSLIITGWDAQALALGFGIAGAIVVLGLGGSAVALRFRCQRV